MKSGSRILRDISKQVKLGLLANIGMSGEEWTWDGAETRGIGATIFIDSSLAVLLAVLFYANVFLFWILGLGVSFLWSIIGAPILADYLELPFPVIGLNEAEAERIYGRKMRVEK